MLMALKKNYANQGRDHLELRTQKERFDLWAVCPAEQFTLHVVGFWPVASKHGLYSETSIPQVVLDVLTCFGCTTSGSSTSWRRVEVRGSRGSKEEARNGRALVSAIQTPMAQWQTDWRLWSCVISDISGSCEGTYLFTTDVPRRVLGTFWASASGASNRSGACKWKVQCKITV